MKVKIIYIKKTAKVVPNKGCKLLGYPELTGNDRNIKNRVPALPYIYSTGGHSTSTHLKRSLVYFLLRKRSGNKALI